MFTTSFVSMLSRLLVPGVREEGRTWEQGCYSGSRVVLFQGGERKVEPANKVVSPCKSPHEQSRERLSKAYATMPKGSLGCFQKLAINWYSKDVKHLALWMKEILD